MRRVSRPALLLIVLVALAACGGVPTAGSSAMLTTESPLIPTVNVIPTQTRVAELSLIATLTAPTPTRLATPGGSDTAGESFVGRLDRSDAFVSIVLDRQKVLA